MLIRYNTIGPDGLWEAMRETEINPAEIIDRDACEIAGRRLSKKTIEVICGPRQSGKTTLLSLLMAGLQKNGTPASDIHYLNLDTLPDHSMFNNPVRFYHLLRGSRAPDGKKKLYLFLDEVQRLPKPGLFLKAIYDGYPDVKMIVSGSSSLELKTKTKEFLTGRKHEIHLLPLSFREIVKHSKKIPAEVFSRKLTPDTIPVWEEYEKNYGRFLRGEMLNLAVFGNYPAVVTERDPAAKTEILFELFNSYVKKDVADFLKVENVPLFNNLVKALAAHAGCLINISQICSIIGGNRITVNKYLNILEETFVVRQLSPLAGNKKNEIKYAKKCYFYDCGMRNLSLAQFEKAPERSDFGALLENLVVTESVKSLNILDEIHYWRTKSGAEVDVVITAGGKPVPIEVKYLSASIGTLSKSFYGFLERYRPARGIFLNRDRFGHVRKNSTDVFYVPAHWFLLRGPELVD